MIQSAPCDLVVPSDGRYEYSSSLLGPAVRLCELLGFVHSPKPATAPHEDADVCMG